MELDNKLTIPDKDNIQIECKKMQEIEYKFLGQLRLIPGLILYEFDYANLTLKPLEVIKSGSYNIATNQESEHNKTIVHKNTIIFQCHNQNAAVKKANRIIKKSLGIELYFKVKTVKA